MIETSIAAIWGNEMHTKFDVELWVNTSGTAPETKVFKTVSASDHYAAVQEARQRVRDENPDINSSKIDTWFTEVLLD